MSRPPTIAAMLAWTSASMSIGTFLRGGSPESTARRSTPAHPGLRPIPMLSFRAMAKRTRYPNRTARTTPRRPQRPASTSPAGARSTPSLADAPIPVDLPDDAPIRATSSSLTDAEIERAAQLEAEANAKERAAIAESLRRRSRGEEREHAPGDVNAPLSVRAAHEYAYVARDVKRIALTASLMIGILAVLYILTNVLGVITL
jgi:hypothetical protein